MKTDTIAAIATAMAGSGIGIVRISGEEAVSITDQIFHMPGGKKLSDMETHTIHYGHIRDGEEVIDEVMVFFCGIHVKGDDVRFPKEGVQVHIGDEVLYVSVPVQVIAQKTAAEAAEMAGHGASNMAGADDAYGGVRYFQSHFSLKREIITAGRLNDQFQLSAAGQHEHDGIIGHAVWRISRVAYTEPDFFAWDVST